MEDPYVIREKALRVGVRTGVAPDLDFIWAAQRSETGGVCFGAFEPTCKPECRWYERCALVSREPINASWLPISEERSLSANPVEPRRTEERWIPPSVRGATTPIRRRPPAQPPIDETGVR